MAAVLLLAGLSTGHKIGLVVVAVIFIGFALLSSFVLPRRNPDFPGRGASVYYLATVVVFACMIAAVAVFGAEGGEKTASAAESANGPVKATFNVVESEWRITLPSASAKTLNAGVYVFHVENHGKLAHNLTVDGPRVSNAHTPNISPGGSADLRVTLASGQYDLFCSIPGHKAEGMDAKLSVG